MLRILCQFGLIWRETKKGFRRKYRKPLILLVGREGFEPTRYFEIANIFMCLRQ
jgi:hypothetical protein